MRAHHAARVRPGAVALWHGGAVQACYACKLVCHTWTQRAASAICRPAVYASWFVTHGRREQHQQSASLALCVTTSGGCPALLRFMATVPMIMDLGIIVAVLRCMSTGPQHSFNAPPLRSNRLALPAPQVLRSWCRDWVKSPATLVACPDLQHAHSGHLPVQVLSSWPDWDNPNADPPPPEDGNQSEMSGSETHISDSASQAADGAEQVSNALPAALLSITLKPWRDWHQRGGCAAAAAAAGR
jgi:hypothetical protein